MIKKIYHDNIVSNLYKNTLIINQQIVNSFADLNNLVNHIQTIYKSGNKIDNTFIKLLNKPAFISDIELVNDGDSIENRIVQKQHYIKKIDENIFLKFNLKQNWLESIIKQIQTDNNATILLFNSDKKLIFSSIQSPDENNEIIDLNSIYKTTDQSLNELNNALKIENVHLLKTDEHFLCFLIYNPQIDTYILVSHSSRVLFKDLRNHSIILIFLFAIALITSSIITIRINKKYAMPYNDIIVSLKSNKYLNIKNTSGNNDSMFIKRSFELLQNQLEFYVQKLEKSSSESLKIENDLKIAKKLLVNILPKENSVVHNSTEFEIHAFSEAVYDIGGDFYDYFLIDKNHLLFVVADIAGKGIPAALFMIFTQTLLKAIVKPGLNVSEITNQLNDKLIEENISDLFVTMFLGILNIKNGKIEYCNAAHNLPLVIKGDGKIEELTNTHGIPLGIYPNRNYQSSVIQLNTNDQFFVYTDGLTDSKDENDLNYSIDVLKYNLMGSWFLSPKEVIDEIRNSVTSFSGTINPVDDMTLLMLKYTHGVNQ